MKTTSEHNCELALLQLQTQLESEDFSETELEQLCLQFPACADSLRSSYVLWQELDELEVPEPSPAMKANFHQMLSEMTAATAEKKPRLAFDAWIWKAFNLKWGMLAGVFALGILLGGLIFRPAGGTEVVISETVQSPVENDNYAALTASSAIDRLTAIQSTKQMEHLDQKIVDALYQILIQDKNVNVRLSAIEAMVDFADNAKVKENLIRAIPYQTSPLIQLTLAEIALALDDKNAINEIKQLLKNGQVEIEVKMKLEETIETFL